MNNSIPFLLARLCAVIAAVFTLLPAAQAASAGGLRVLFLGDNGHHRPSERFRQLQPVLAPKGIEMVYTDQLADLNPAKLAGFDCLAIFANHTEISPAQEKAILDFVEAGGGLAPLHCASYCFLNSPKYIALVGGQFQSHGAGVFKDTIVKADHPVMEGVSGIESWDESYVHTKHNTNRVVLAERRDEKGAEPYTWVREHGKGRVFYTAWGHDQRTWSNAAFQTLVENGIRWASANSPTQLKPVAGLKPFEYENAAGALPNYVEGAAWGTQAEPITTMQKPLSPEESAKHMVTFPEFKTTLFAAEPDIVKAIWIDWDERGRLWIAETIDYPNEMRPIGEGRDRLKICEDTNGDGKADKFTVFADKLSVPTGFVFANGGVIVVHSGLTELFQDTDGDDKADVRKTLFTGWGTGDTHAGPSNLRYGMDNWIWGTVGYSGFRGTVGGKEIRFGQGIFRFKPDGSALEFIRSSNNNTWGLGLTEDNLIIGSTANNNASMYMPIPNRYYEAVNGWSAARLESIADSQRFYPITTKVRQVDQHGRYTAGSGSAIYTARSFPKEYWNKVQFVAEPTGHLLGKFHLERRGADFIAHNGRNFLASDDEWSSPVAAEVGPDGALWVSDWYNYIIQHNPTPRGFQNGKGNAYETPLRDKVHGRIYRVAHTGSSATARASEPLRKGQPEQLVARLKSDNMLWRTHAQRLLVERGQKDVVPALCDLARDSSVDEISLNPAAMHALWTLHGLGALDGSDAAATQTALAALKHPAAGVRRAALMVAPRNSSALDAILASQALGDADAQVRLAALLALAEMPPSEAAGQAIFAALQNPKNADDRWIADGAVAAAARHDAGFLKAALASYKPAEGAKEIVSTNLVPNSSIENVSDGRPANWRPVMHSGPRPELGVAEFGRTGSKSLKISASQPTDASWAVVASVQPRTDYQLTAWMKTEKVQKVGNAQGALLNIHELQDPVKGVTKPMVGDNEWTQVKLIFNSGEMTRVTINCLMGGWGRAQGTAWFDDIELTLAPGGELAGATGRVLRLVTTHYAERAPADTIFATLASLQGASPSVTVAVLDGLVSGWPEDKSPAIGAADRESLGRLMQSMPESSRDRLLALSQRWGQPDLFGANIEEILKGLKEKISNASLDEDERVRAARRLIGLSDSPENAEIALAQVTLLASPSLANGLVNALGDARNPRMGQMLVAHWAQLTPAVRRSAIAALMRRTEWTRALLDAVERKNIQRTDLAAEHWSQLRQNPNPAISGRAGRLSSAGGGVSSDRKEIVDKLISLAKEKGDPARGKEVFKANCANCHVYNGEGGKIGPDLSGVGSRDRADILLEILDPNRSVEANYRLWNVTTKDGESFSGRLEAETQTSVEILDVNSQKHVIQRKDIASLDPSQLSIMPAGFEALPPEDLKALLEYLGQHK